MSSLHELDPVVAGFVSFTEILDGDHRAYNAWHMLDHMPEQMPIPGIKLGQRWVVTPECADLAPLRVAPFDAVHYLTCYLMTEPLRATLRSFYELAGALRDADRFHGPRRSHLAGPLRRTGAWAAERVLVSPAAIPYRPHRGVIAVLEQQLGPIGRDPVADIAPALLDHAGVAGIWTFASDPELGRTGGAEQRYRVAIAFCDDDPLAVARRSGDQLAAGLASAGATLLLATPMLAITAWQWDWFEDRP